MMKKSEIIWILDLDSDAKKIYRSVLDEKFTLIWLEDVEDLVGRLKENNDLSHVLMLADPISTKGSLTEAFEGARIKGERKLQLPHFLIVTAKDDLDFLRFFLRCGARDFVLKPLRQKDLLLRVERAFSAKSDRELVLVRQDLDGIQIDNLTYREHQLLTILLNKNNRSASREEIQKTVWNRVFVNRKTLDVHLFNLRRKIRTYGYDVRCEKQIFTLYKMSV